MRILVISLHNAPEPVGVGVYTAGMARTLVQRGHAVSIISAKPSFPKWRIEEAYAGGLWRSAVEDGVKVVRCPTYIPKVPTGARRMLHYCSFAFSALIPAMWQSLSMRPQVVMTIAPTLMAAPLSRVVAVLAGAKTWLHVQDLEVDAAVATGQMAGAGRARKLALRFERAMLGLFDRVSTISPPMCRKLAEKGVAAARIVEFRNWSDLTPMPAGQTSSYRQEWGLTGRTVALYSGSIGNKQGLEIIVEAARRLSRRDDLSIVICGEGPNRAALVALAQGLGDVIQFHDLQPKARLAELLALADIHLLPQLAEAADLVLPSKLGNMMASGRPVIAAAATGTGLAMEVEGCGLIVEPGNADDFAAAIERLMDDRCLASKLGATGRTRAGQRFDLNQILGQFERQLEELIDAPRGADPDVG